jgi:hypothetical protein
VSTKNCNPTTMMNYLTLGAIEYLIFPCLVGMMVKPQ